MALEDAHTGGSRSLSQFGICPVTWKAHLDTGTRPSGPEANGWKIKSTNRDGILKRLKRTPNTARHHRWVPRGRAFIARPLAGGPHRPAEEVWSSPGTGRDPATSSPSAPRPALSRGWSRPGPRARRHPAHLRSPGWRCPRAARGAVVGLLPTPGDL